jgi:hypothetical protein
MLVLAAMPGAAPFPYANLKAVDNKVMLPGGTKATLEKLPQFQFAAK